jgi:hypothetical protein
VETNSKVFGSGSGQSLDVKETPEQHKYLRILQADSIQPVQGLGKVEAER